MWTAAPRHGCCYRQFLPVHVVMRISNGEYGNLGHNRPQEFPASVGFFVLALRSNSAEVRWYVLEADILRLPSTHRFIVYGKCLVSGARVTVYCVL